MAAQNIRNNTPSVHHEKLHQTLMAIRKVSDIGRRTVNKRAEPLREDLNNLMIKLRPLGVVPSMFKIMGFSHKEVPYNKALAWIMDPSESHQAGRAVLKNLCKGFKEEISIDVSLIEKEIEDASSSIEVRGEKRWPVEAQSWRIPDILIVGRKFGLLIENKVASGESGDSQYASYYQAMRRLAKSKDWKTCHCFLAHPKKSPRACPEGYSGTIAHDRLAKWIRRVEEDATVPAWGRIACQLVAVEITPEKDLFSELQKAQQTLDETSNKKRFHHRHIREMTRALEVLSPIQPGEKGK